MWMYQWKLKQCKIFFICIFFINQVIISKTVALTTMYRPLSTNYRAPDRSMIQTGRVLWKSSLVIDFVFCRQPFLCSESWRCSKIKLKVSYSLAFTFIWCAVNNFGKRAGLLAVICTCDVVVTEQSNTYRINVSSRLSTTYHAIFKYCVQMIFENVIIEGIAAKRYI